ncbi:PAS domain S-box protein [Methylobacterium sp. Leaf108]|uniref:PAS domain S-box protein n=1 Tax=Methylobacterium sp. Leaf108 TaxID=1736256 RepID=UPI0006FFF548|nr:PAS domain S-box protein [Methylobacterium sp. Leaf108]KQP52558.1 hypothetical protein ASF39_06465 [Methylobacterium sp. Leaf108]
MSDKLPIAAIALPRLRFSRDPRIVGTEHDPLFEAVCQVARSLFDLPVAAVSLVAADRVRFGTVCGPSLDGAGKDDPFSRHAIASDDVFVVEDASRDPRFSRLKLVAGPPGIRFYAGAALTLESGLRVGTLCVLDVTARTFRADRRRRLRDLAAVVSAHLQIHSLGPHPDRNAKPRDAGEPHDRTSDAKADDVLPVARRFGEVGHIRLEWPTGDRAWSAEARRIYGFGPDEAAPGLDQMLLRHHPDDRERARAIVAAASAARRGFHYEARIVGPSGDIRSVVVGATCETAVDRPDAFVIVTEDVTDPPDCEARRAVRESQARLIVEGLTVCAISLLDPNGIVIDWHAGGERIFGYKPEEIVGRHLSHLRPDDDRADASAKAIVAAARARGRAEVEGWRQHKDGTRFWASDLLEPLRDGAGRLVGFVCLSRDVTSRRQRAEALRISEARYRQMADSASDMIVRLDREGRRTYVSPASRALIDYAPEELIGLSPRDGIHPDDVPAFDRMIAGLVSGERDRAVAVSRLRHRDGRWIWVEASLQIQRDARGRPDGFITAVRDTSQRRRAEEALRESEARYRILADTLPQMVWIMDRDSRDTVYANRRFETYHGRIGTTFVDRLACYHPDDRAPIERAWNDGTIASDGRWEADVRLAGEDGAHRWHRLVIVPIMRDGEVVNWLGTALDIHDAVTDRDALRQSADLLRIAQTAAGAGTWDVVFADGAIAAVILSHESAAMHGLEGDGPATMTADTWSGLVHPHDADLVWAAVRRAVETGESYSAEFRVLLPDGGIRWLHGIGSAYVDAQGHPLRMVGLNFDVDRRKHAEAVLIEAGHAAEAARIEAEAANAAKSDFLAAMSHEIRTPLNSIIGYTEMLLDEPGQGAPDRIKLGRILGSGRALLTIVNDVLDFSKIEAGRVELEPEAFSLSALVADTMAMISGLVADKPLTLRTDIDPDLPRTLVGDQNRLRQVLLNLLNNAVKFTHAGEVALTLRGERRKAGTLHLRCEVGDTGIGVPQDRRDRLFLRFSQVDGSISRRFGGTGLGLAISRSLVELMGGRIGMESRPGGGSTFWFTVDLAIGASVPAAADVAPHPAAAHRPARILLVEDVMTNQEIAMAVLAGAGHEVDVACDGAEAVHAAQRTLYDVILMDVQMPVMDGLEATARIRAMGGRRATIPILALTANVLPDQVAAFKAAGMVDHVGKPFRRAELLAAVARWTASEQGTAAGPAAVDRATFDELRDLLGGEKLARMLCDLDGVLRTGFLLEPTTHQTFADPERDLAGIAHRLISSAGMLGFTPLSETCRAFERASRAGTLTQGDIEEAAEASRLALAAMAGLHRDLGTPVAAQPVRQAS